MGEGRHRAVFPIVHTNIGFKLAKDAEKPDDHKQAKYVRGPTLPQTRRLAHLRWKVQEEKIEEGHLIKRIQESEE